MGTYMDGGREEGLGGGSAEYGKARVGWVYSKEWCGGGG
jgi:hypothetical protein